MRPSRRGALLGLALAAAALPAQAGQNSATRTPEAAAAACVPAQGEAAKESASRPVLLDGLGYAGIAPDTENAAARRWFEQGVRLIWAYDEVEAVRAFEEAQRLDPRCAMCFWGEAWARGPTLNLQPRNEEHGKATAAAAKALALAGRLGPRDRALVEATRVRTGGDGVFADKAYAKAMAKLARRFPADDAVLVMAADSHIILAARKPVVREGTAPQRLLETVLARNPDHSGAIHLYIHLTDMIERQDLAERYADRLGRLAPGASHLVHMPSHTYFGVGRYRDAAAVNVRALEVDRDFVARAKPAKSDYRVGLYAHNNHFAIQSALMQGDGATALRMAEHFRERYPGEGGRPMIRASTWVAAGLHAPVEDVLAMKEPDSTPMKAIRLYARGEALARKGDPAGVRAEAAALAKLREGPSGRALGGPSGEAIAEIAQKVLEGRAAMLERRFPDAVAAFRAAMTRQASAGFGSDPPPFWYPARRSLAAAMLASGNPADARLQLLASLKEWPNDPLALHALALAEKALGRPDAAAAYAARARSGWNGDVETVGLARI